MGIALDEAKRMGLALPGLALAHQLYLALRAQGQQITTVEVSRVELRNLLGAKAKELGLIDFDPDTVQVIETDAGLGTHEIIFEREIIPTGGA